MATTQPLSSQTLGEQIRTLREARHLSYRTFASQTNLSTGFLSDLELGRRYPSKKTLSAIATTLQTDFDELMNYHPRPVIEALTKRLYQDPKMIFALRRILEENISADELIALCDQKRAQAS